MVAQYSQRLMKLLSVILLVLANFAVVGTQTTYSAEATQSNESWLSSEYGYQLAAGNSTACVVVSDGSVRCWGSNSSGQLGNGNFKNQTKPVKVTGISNAISVSVGDVHSCALIRGGTVKCWGHSAFGELGNGVSGENTKDYATPVSVKNLSGVTQISVGGYLSCALLATKQVKCWGAFGAPGSDEEIRENPTVIDGISEATNLAAGTRQVCVIKQDRTSACSNRWPREGWTPVSVGAADAIAIEASGDNACLLTLSGTVHCWDFDTPDEPHPSMSGPNISSFSMSSCMSKTDGTAWCRYVNNYGQLGNNSAPGFFTDDFVKVSGINDVISIVGSGSRTCALLASGSVKCWGANRLGQVGDGSNKNRFVPTQVSGLNQGVFKSSITSNSIDLNWVGSLAPIGSQVSDYIIRYRKENDSVFQDWVDTQSATRSLSINSLDSATSYRLQISPVVNGEVLDGTIYKFGTKGTGTVEVQLETSDHFPVRFGKYSWKSTDGTAKSSTSREANALGYVSLPSVPAKEISITVANGQLANGSTISGTFTAIASKGRLLLTAPAAPQYVSKRVQVKLSGGEAVPNSTVYSMNLDSEVALVEPNFEVVFSSPPGINGVTDSQGWVTLKGFATDDIYVQATYDDGQLDQSTEFIEATETETVLNLGFLPVLQVSSDSFESSLNSIIEIPVSVGSVSPQSASLSIAALRAVNVRVVAPAGSNQKACGKNKTVLATKTDTLGRAKLKICANMSGEYTFVSSGAVSAGSVTVHVTRSKPMAVTNLNLSSATAGSVLVTWGTPLFDGNSAIDSYKVELKSGNTKKSLIITSTDLRFSERLVSFAGLPVARLWTAEVQAHNQHGWGPVTAASVVLER